MNNKTEIDLTEKTEKVLSKKRKIIYLILGLGGLGLSIIAIIISVPYFILMGGAY